MPHPVLTTTRPPLRGTKCRPTLVAALATALVLVVAGAPVAGATVAAPGAEDAVPATATRVAEPGSRAECRRPLLAAPTPASTAVRRLAGRGEADLTEAAGRNGVAAQALHRIATDEALWLDTCGQAFYLEPAVEAPPRGDPALAATDGREPLTETFALQSRPGAPVTIFLDFTGGTVSGTAWNRHYGDPIVVAPFSLTAPVDTAFSAEELLTVQRVWEVVAEDFAPFDVNVTTRDPGADALERSGAEDRRFGTRVLITDSGAIGTACRCAGLAYVGTIDRPQHSYYSPAWVFTAGTGSTGRSIGEAASHEAGHTFGLAHDGDGSRAYALGSAPWAPIMGAGYYHPLTQWSRGEYPGATNLQDDVAMIASVAGAAADDHPDSAAAATVLTPGSPTAGLIGSRGDVDAFRFETGAGPVTVTAVPASPVPDLDVGLQIVDATGAVLAAVDPPAVEVSRSLASGLDATWTGDLPAGRYTVLVDGVGSDPGGYSDYASLGRYLVDVAVADEALTLRPNAVELVVGEPVRQPVGDAQGGRPPLTWSATGLPAGLAVDPATGQLSGSPRVGGTYATTLAVRDARGTTATAPLTLTVGPVLYAPGQDLAAVAGEAFTGRLTASGGSGDYTWRSAEPHPWLRLTPDGGLSGTPPAAGSTTWLVQVVSGSQSRSVQVTVTATERSLPLTVEPLEIEAVAGQPFAATLTARGSAEPLVWSATDLPPGVELHRDGTLVGRPATQGWYRFVVHVRSPEAWGEGSVTLRVTPQSLDVADQTVRLRRGSGQPGQLTAGGGIGDYRWSAVRLPRGIRLDPDGAVRATRAAVGVHSFPVVVVSGTQRAEGVVTVRVVPGPVAVADRRVRARAGRPIRLRLSAAGGDGDYGWRARWLPRGLRLSRTGRLTGSVARPGRYLVRVRAVSAGRADTGVVRLRVTR